MKNPSPKVLLSGKFIYQECLHAGSILSETDTFEEYPLIHRNFQYENWKKAFPTADIFSMWVGIAVFLLSYYKKLDSDNNLGERFLCITINGFDEIEDDRPPVPNIFTSTKINQQEFIGNLKLKAPSVDSKEMMKVKSGFAFCNELRNFSFYESRFFDDASKSEIIRVYCTWLIL